jgi:hypothetical protein
VSSPIPCPFCGGSVKAEGASYSATITCRGCGIAVQAYMSLERLIEKWNARAGKKGEFTDTQRLNRLLKKGGWADVIVTVNEYGYGDNGKPAHGNSCVSIEDRPDIDSVLRREIAREKQLAAKKNRTLYPGRRPTL